MGSRQKRKRKKREKRMCRDKVAYPSMMAALDAAVRTGLTWYHCPYCNKWHLTSHAKHRAHRGNLKWG